MTGNDNPMEHESRSMEIDDITYDIDNVDIEDEMECRDIADEEKECEELMERHDEENVMKMSAMLNARNLDTDLSKQDENDRRHYSFKCRGTAYTGFVVFRLAPNMYLFSVEASDASTGRKTMKFNLNELKQIH